VYRFYHGANVYEKIVCFCLSSHVKYNTHAINFEDTKNAYATIQAGQYNLTLSNLIKQGLIKEANLLMSV
jgi:hypothetical protein